MSTEDPLSHSDDPLHADDKRNAVKVSEMRGFAYALGNEAKDEWLKSEDMEPIDLSEMR